MKSFITSGPGVGDEIFNFYPDLLFLLKATLDLWTI